MHFDPFLGGAPHAVRNVQDIHGLSGNYVDSSNYRRFLTDAVVHWDLDKLDR